jgi:hypothetical protein
MRMFCEPRRRVLAAKLVHIDDRANLQPSEESMKAGRTSDVLPSPLHALNRLKPAEKQEQVPDAYALIGEV